MLRDNKISEPMIKIKKSGSYSRPVVIAETKKRFELAEREVWTVDGKEIDPSIYTDQDDSVVPDEMVKVTKKYFKEIIEYTGNQIRPFNPDGSPQMETLTIPDGFVLVEDGASQWLIEKKNLLLELVVSKESRKLNIKGYAEYNLKDHVVVIDDEQADESAIINKLL